MQVFVRTPSSSLTLEVKPSDTIRTVKELIEATEGMPVYNQRLLWVGRELQDDHTLLDLNIPSESTLHLMYRLRGHQRGTTPRASAPALLSAATRKEFGSRPASRRLFREWTLLQDKDPKLALPSGVSCSLAPTPAGDRNLVEWHLVLPGPSTYVVCGQERACPYADALLDVTVHFPDQYPFEQPQVYFVPGVVLHPNVCPTNGELESCLVGQAMRPDKNVGHLAVRVLEILARPDDDHASNMEALTLMREDLAGFEARAACAALSSRMSELRIAWIHAVVKGSAMKAA